MTKLKINETPIAMGNISIQVVASKYSFPERRNGNSTERCPTPGEGWEMHMINYGHYMVLAETPAVISKAVRANQDSCWLTVTPLEYQKE